MSPPKVLIIGCGIAGPVLAVLLQKKGYHPIVFEKVRELGDAGASLMLMPNGLKVLSTINFASQALDSTIPLAAFRDQTSSGETLGESRFPETLRQQYGCPAAGVKRTTLNLALKQLLIDHEIELREGWALEDVEEGDDGVVAMFRGGRKERGAFLVGCDGIKAASRGLLLRQKGIEEEVPSYTGLTQTAGFSPTPRSLPAHAALLNIFGPSAHLITYPVSPTHSSWAITLPETAAAQETWRLYTKEEIATLKPKLLSDFADWTSPVAELINGAERITKYGLFDREELPADRWYSSRCVLVGDAAHPTSPHLGQGANQALEDCYHLATLLPSVESDNVVLSQLELTRAFKSFAELRQPRTAALVKGARAQGERRVVTGGAAACRERDEAVKAAWRDERALVARFERLFQEPFQMSLLSNGHG